MKTLSWGIAGTSKISHDFHSAITADFTDLHHEVLAVASRTERRANLFAKEHNILVSYGSYEDLANDFRVQAVYIGSSSFLHYGICKTMINAGKHVLCEAPLGLSSKEVEELLQLAKGRDVLLMTGLWSRFFPAYSYVENLLNMEKLGEVKDIYIKIGRQEHQKTTDKKMAGGVVYSSLYPALQFVQFVYKEVPRTIRAEGKIDQFGVAMYLEVDFIFSSGKTATVVCSSIENLKSQANVIGRKGVLILPSFECPTNAIFGTYKKENWTLFESKTPTFFKNTQGLRYEADEVWKCIREERFYSNKVSSRDVMDLAKIVDEIRNQLSIAL